jgi:TetR/AcrR family transcriptional repressor of uid operon
MVFEGSAAAEVDAYSERILAATRELLARHGLRRTSLQDIARAAGVGPATLYRRFASRDVLLARLIEREARELFTRVDDAVAAITDPEEALVASFLVFTRALREHDLLQALIASDPERVLPLLTSQGAPLLAAGRSYLAAHLQRARDNGAQLTAEPEILAEIFVRVAHSLILTTDTVLPMHDDQALAKIARATFARLAFTPI